MSRAGAARSSAADGSLCVVDIARDAVWDGRARERDPVALASLYGSERGLPPLAVLPIPARRRTQHPLLETRGCSRGGGSLGRATGAAWDAVMGGVGSANPSNSNSLGLDTSHEASLRRPKPTREPGRQVQASRPAHGRVPRRAGRGPGYTRRRGENVLVSRPDSRARDTTPQRRGVGPYWWERAA